MRISDWSSDVCSSDLVTTAGGSVVRGSCAGTAWDAYVLDQVLDVLRHRLGQLHRDVGGDEVDDGADRAEAQRRDAEQPVLRGVGEHVRARDEEPALVGEQIHAGGDKSGQHARHGASGAYLLGGMEET